MKPAWRKLTRLGLILAVSFAALGPRPLPRAQAANGVVTAPCNEAAFTTTLNQVQASGGGTLTFNCGAVTSIILSSTKTITSTVTIDGGGVMTLSGGNVTRHFYITPGAALTLSRLTVSNGYANGDGGAIYNQNGRLVVDQSTFRDNQTTLAGSGGAIFTLGPLTVTASLFEDNQGANAGALFPFHANAVTYIANSTFRRNRTTSPTDGWGGALTNWDGAPVTIVGSQFISNTARTGGAIVVFGPMTVRNSQVLSNTSSPGHGGGIYNISTLHLVGVTVQGNRITPAFAGKGGGLSNLAGTVVITGSTFYNNFGYEGHDIHQAGTLTMTNSTLYSTVGSPLMVTAAGSSTLLRFVTIASPSAGNTLVQNGQNTVFQMRNVLISNQGPGFFGVCSTHPSGPPMTSLGNNLASDASCNLIQTNDLPNTPGLLGPLANNGGPTQTMAPLPGSQAFDNGACQAYAPTDQRGLLRPQGLACDIGAVEVQTYWELFVPLQHR